MLSQLGNLTHGELKGTDIGFNTVSTDTRSLKKGDVFFALRGENFDGHEFVVDAEKAGAKALVVEAFVVDCSLPQLIVKDSVQALGLAGKLKRERFEGTVVAVTGSNGKTTVKGMLASIFSQCGEVSVTEGNFNNHIGVPLTLISISETSDYAVIEAGTSNVGEISYLCNLIQPDIALVNNVMAAHLQGFGSEQAIAEEKSAIYGSEGLRAGVVNLMDTYCLLHLTKLDQKARWGFAVVEDFSAVDAIKDRYASAVDHVVIGIAKGKDDFGRYVFDILFQHDLCTVQLAVAGRHNISNALAAAACALAAGISLAQVVAGLKKFQGVPGRMQLMNVEGCRLLVNDTYNANPGSMKAAIDFLSQYQNSVLVIGDMGEIGVDEVKAHKEIGIYALRSGINQLLGVGPLCKHAVDAFGENAYRFEERRNAAVFLKKQTLKNSVVLVKGSRSAKMELLVSQLTTKEGDC